MLIGNYIRPTKTCWWGSFFAWHAFVWHVMVESSPNYYPHCRRSFWIRILSVNFHSFISISLFIRIYIRIRMYFLGALSYIYICMCSLHGKTHGQFALAALGFWFGDQKVTARKAFQQRVPGGLAAPCRGSEAEPLVGCGRKPWKLFQNSRNFSLIYH